MGNEKALQDKLPGSLGAPSYDTDDIAPEGKLIASRASITPLISPCLAGLAL